MSLWHRPIRLLIKVVWVGLKEKKNWSSIKKQIWHESHKSEKKKSNWAAVWTEPNQDTGVRTQETTDPKLDSMTHQKLKKPEDIFGVSTIYGSIFRGFSKQKTWLRWAWIRFPVLEHFLGSYDLRWILPNSIKSRLKREIILLIFHFNVKFNDWLHHLFLHPQLTPAGM